MSEEIQGYIKLSDDAFKKIGVALKDINTYSEYTLTNCNDLVDEWFIVKPNPIELLYGDKIERGTPYAIVSIIGEYKIEEGDFVGQKTYMANSIRIEKLLNLSELIESHRNMLIKEGDDIYAINEAALDAHGNSSSIGDYCASVTYGLGNISATAKYAPSVVIGMNSKAITLCDESHAVSINKDSSSVTKGHHSIACALGPESWACAGESGAIAIADWRPVDRSSWKEFTLFGVYSAMVGEEIKGVTIRPGVRYWFFDGALISSDNTE